MNAPRPIRVRLRYSVRGKVRFLSHRDMARVTERAIRRAGVPVAYSQGFSPRPKLHYGLALSTGYESDSEFLDLDLDPDRVGIREPQAIAEAMGECLPRGVRITAAASVPPGEPSLQDCVTSTSWEIVVGAHDVAAEELRERCEALLSASTHEIEIVRKGKQVIEDLRPLLLHLSVVTPTGSGKSIDEPCLLHAELGTKPRSVRPAELWKALGVTEPLLVRRTHQWKQTGDRPEEPLGLGESPRTEVRAS